MVERRLTWLAGIVLVWGAAIFLKLVSLQVLHHYEYARMARAHQELDPDAHIVVYCHHGVRSLNVTNWLRQQGFEKVQSMRGGIAAWSRA